MSENDDTALLVAHLLGGTAGLDLSHYETPQQIELLVAQAVRVAREIKKTNLGAKRCLIPLFPLAICRFPIRANP
jgi:hypothetical protein